MTIEHKIFFDEQLLVLKFIGKFSVTDYMRFTSDLMETEMWKKVTKVLLDLSQIEITEIFKHIEPLAEFRRKKIQKELFTVYLVKTPTSTVAVHLYKESLPEFMYNYCFTPEHAFKLLNLNESSLESIENWLK